MVKYINQIHKILIVKPVRVIAGRLAVPAGQFLFVVHLLEVQPQRDGGDEAHNGVFMVRLAGGCDIDGVEFIGERLNGFNRLVKTGMVVFSGVLRCLLYISSRLAGRSRAGGWMHASGDALSHRAAARPHGDRRLRDDGLRQRME